MAEEDPRPEPPNKPALIPLDYYGPSRHHPPLKPLLPPPPPSVIRIIARVIYRTILIIGLLWVLGLLCLGAMVLLG
jgi:hypothetical protein